MGATQRKLHGFSPAGFIKRYGSTAFCSFSSCKRVPRRAEENSEVRTPIENNNASITGNGEGFYALDKCRDVQPLPPGADSAFGYRHVLIFAPWKLSMPLT